MGGREGGRKEENGVLQGREEDKFRWKRIWKDEIEGRREEVGLLGGATVRRELRGRGGIR